MKHLVCDFTISKDLRSIYYTVVRQDPSVYRFLNNNARCIRYNCDGEIIGVWIDVLSYPEFRFSIIGPPVVCLYLRGDRKSRDNDLVLLNVLGNPRNVNGYSCDFIVDAAKSAINNLNKELDDETRNY